MGMLVVKAREDERELKQGGGGDVDEKGIG